MVHEFVGQQYGNSRQACLPNLHRGTTHAWSRQQRRRSLRESSVCLQGKQLNTSQRDRRSSQHKDVSIRSRTKTIENAHNNNFQARQRSCLDAVGVTGRRRRDSLHGRALRKRKSTADMGRWRRQHGMKEKNTEPKNRAWTGSPRRRQRGGCLCWCFTLAKRERTGNVRHRKHGRMPSLFSHGNRAALVKIR